MESARIEMQKSLVKEISKGMRQLKQVKVSCTEQERVVERMVSSYEEALSILTALAPEEGQCESVMNPRPASSPSARKRKRMINVPGAYDDGYSWRKYGENNILNSIYPRSFYRCKLRHSMSCLATKRVQRSENDPTTFDVTYIGVHTCRSENDPTKSMAISASSNTGHIGQDQEPQMDFLNEMAHHSELLEDFGGILD